MSFVVWAALAITGLVVAPLVAHLLRRGRATLREFPAATLVPALKTTARERSRLEDLPLLLVRGLIVAGLAVLGATPLVRCNRLSLARTEGASVALGIVLDDSLSMRATPPGETQRWAGAKAGAEELLRSARDGDAVTIVLAGRPARVALAPTTDLTGARHALEEMEASDRSTDLGSAVALARSAVKGLPQRDHRVVVLSDLAGDDVSGGTPPVTTPLPALARPVDDCGIASAERRGSRIVVTVACSSGKAAAGRHLEVVAKAVKAGREQSGKPRAPGEVVAAADLAAREGEQTIALEASADAVLLDVRLDGKDDSPHDDDAPVAEESTAPRVGVMADRTAAAAKTGGPTVIEQALSALGGGFIPSPVPVVPDDVKALAGMGVLILDDPRGFSPEARSTLSTFLERGGVGLALLGRRAGTAELSSTLEPFARGAARFEEVSGLAIDRASVAWLGPESESLGSVARRGRVRLDGTLIDGAAVAARWADGVPWLVERHVGRGLCLTLGLPASLDDSELALRPAFLALLDHVLRQADLRSGARRTSAGTPWSFPAVKELTLDGPTGPLASTPGASEGCGVSAVDDCDETGFRATPGISGRYVVRVDGQEETRFVTVEPAEILAPPRAPAAISSSVVDSGEALTPASREFAVALIVLFAAELALRQLRRWSARRREPGDPAGAT